jgi:trans-2,3-dihydro-3-hydroxyanthranilate isomerase
MKLRYATVDVFTEKRFSGNPLAVVLDAEGLSTTDMQAIAAEFGYGETTFVSAATDGKHTAQLRIFSPKREMLFAGHPIIGTAFVLGQEAVLWERLAGANIVFATGAGQVTVNLLMEEGKVVGADLVAPKTLTLGSKISSSDLATCLSLAPEMIRDVVHAPQVASVGLPFVIVELASRVALTRCVVDSTMLSKILPVDGASAIYAYTRDSDERDTLVGGCDLNARMFTLRMTEDPATGSAAAATAALILSVSVKPSLALRIRQGVDMGRPSVLLASAARAVEGIFSRIGGRCVPVMDGTFVSSATFGLTDQ